MKDRQFRTVWPQYENRTMAALPDLTGERPEWRSRALCAEVDPEIFFPEKGESVRKSKQICQGCEVRAECLDYALEHDERFGVWGGLSERQRRNLKRDGGQRAA